MAIVSHLHHLFNPGTCQSYLHTLRWKDRPLQLSLSRLRYTLTVSLDVSYLATSSCGCYRDQIQPRNAH
jgi:hypothetical protein